MAQRVIFLADMESFFASVEVADRPELSGRPVVVAGDPTRRHGIILAATKEAKRCGVKTAMPLFEAERLCPELIIVRPHMARYIDVSLAISKILYRYSDQVEPYSIDEQFMDMTHTLHLFGAPEEVARHIQRAIYEETGVRARIGVAPNKLLAKMACEARAKKLPEGIFVSDSQNFKQWMHPLPVEELFGVGSRMKRHLNGLGIRTIGQLAHFPVERLRQRFGLVGERLWRHANGIDPSPVTSLQEELQKGIGHGVTLPYDYRDRRAIEVVLLELTDEVCRRARRHGVKGRTVFLGVRGADFSRESGFNRQMKLPEATHLTSEVYGAVRALFSCYWRGEAVRQLSVALGELEKGEGAQLTLFYDRLRASTLAHTVDTLKARFGPTSVLRAVSLLPGALSFERARKIGGHEA
ncbi:MAG: DNA polymerase IV [Candidatus Carbobacillus altaicus]|nr:DNA polymerase IV [Candidatus Carbobacillus altaicus]